MKLFSRKKKEGPVVPPKPKETVYYFPIKHAFGLDFSDASLKAVEISQKNGKYSGRKILKSISDDYLTRKNGTEFH